MNALSSLLPLAMLSRNVLTLEKSISLAIYNTLYLGFSVDIASLCVCKIPFWVRLCFHI